LLLFALFRLALYSIGLVFLSRISDDEGIYPVGYTLLAPRA